jgi:hypothetical protein
MMDAALGFSSHRPLRMDQMEVADSGKQMVRQRPGEHDQGGLESPSIEQRGRLRVWLCNDRWRT